MLVLTGTDGFIGKNIYEYFAKNTIEKILTVDFKSEIDPFIFLENLKSKKFKDIHTIVHNGACSDTMYTDPEYMMKHNFDYNLSLFKHCRLNNIRLIYASSASVYGDGPFHEKTYMKPKNLYAMSKCLFDDYVSCFKSDTVGLRYFNVYGKYEEHKEHMSSVIYKFFNQVKEGEVKLFEDSHRFLRDFVYIEDVCDIIYKIYLDKQFKGIINVGTGKERSFLEIAEVFREKYNVPIKEIEMPDALKGNYQEFTKSDNSKFNSFFKHEYHTLEEGIQKYLKYLESK